MEPNQQPVGNPNVQPNPNQLPGNEPLTSPEIQPEPRSVDLPPVGAQSGTVPPQVASIQPLPVPSLADPNASGGAPVDSATPGPSVASDVDIIEKEWVDHAQEIIKDTQDDPYREEEAVEALQQDYLKKRYGHDIKKPDSP